MAEPALLQATETTVTRLYAFGSNGCGQLGVGHFEDLSSPQRCKFFRLHAARDKTPDTDFIQGAHTIRKIVAGGNHTLVLLTNGIVYAAGSNVDGRCGILSSEMPQENGHNELVSKFMKMSLRNNLPPEGNTLRDLDYITDIATTWEASFLVCGRDPSKIYACGTGYKGELGIGEGRTEMRSPLLVIDVNDSMSNYQGRLVEHSDSVTTISSISACMNHVVLITSAGDVFGWGASRKGQLGRDLQAEKIVWTPTRLDIPFKPFQVVTGRDFTFLIGVNGEQVFLGESKYFDLPVKLPENVSDTSVFAGWTSLELLKDGRLTGFGRNDRGQLPPPDVPSVRSFASGSEHSIASLIDHDLVAWGWGEHGNCGSPINEKGNVVGKWNVIKCSDDESATKGESIQGLGAGCATSFFWTKVNE